MFLTQDGGLIVKPLARLLGAILSLIYDFLNSINIESIGIAIILFTLIIRLILIPFMVKQNKSTKIMNYIQPEINKINKKYKGRKDNESVMAQQRETQEIQKKYGVSMTSGCLTSLIQFPIFIALYRVIQNIPAYVPKIKELYIPFSKAIANDEQAFKILENFKNESTIGTVKAVNLESGNINSIIDVFSHLPSSQWKDVADLYSNGNLGDIAANINQSGEVISHLNTFLGGIDLTTTPSITHFSAAMAIPILSCLFQFLSMNVTPQQSSSNDPTQQQTMKTMKTMMYMFPIMSFFVTLSVPCGLGLYWAVGALISFFTTIGINLYFKHCDMEKLVQKSMEKAAKKNAKKAAKGKKSFMEKLQEAALGTEGQEPTAHNSLSGTNLKSYTSNTMKSSEQTTQYRPGSLAAKANAMQRYNNKE